MLSGIVAGADRNRGQLSRPVWIRQVKDGNETRFGHDVRRAIQSADLDEVQAITIASDAMILSYRKETASLALRHRLLSVAPFRSYAEAGCLVAFGPSILEMYRRAATYVDRILKGANPADLSVEQPTKFELFINMKTAKALGLTIPPPLLARADLLIE